MIRRKVASQRVVWGCWGSPAKVTYVDSAHAGNVASLLGNRAGSLPSVIAKIVVGTRQKQSRDDLSMSLVASVP